MVVFELKPGYFRIHDGKTAYNVYVNDKRDFSDLPDMEKVYQVCKYRKMDDDEIIDTLLRVYHTQRLFKQDYLEDLSLVFGLIGPRGSGKSVGGAAIAVIDFLLTGKVVWSNMNIELVVAYRSTTDNRVISKLFSSQPLDKAALMDINDFESQFANGLIMIDEVNIEIGDSRRSMANSMVFFDYMLQEIRKRKMNILYQLQSEQWSGGRLRWQTDIYIICRDSSFISGKPSKESIGRFSKWSIHDMSGIITGELKYNPRIRDRIDPYKTITFWNTPFWNTYSTAQLQRHQKFDPTKVDKVLNDTELVINSEEFAKLTTSYNVLPEMVMRLINTGMVQTTRDDIWRILGIEDHSTKTKVGQLLKQLGCEDYRQSDGQRGYRFPDSEVLKARLNEIGIKT